MIGKHTKIPETQVEEYMKRLCESNLVTRTVIATADGELNSYSVRHEGFAVPLLLFADEIAKDAHPFFGVHSREKPFFQRSVDSGAVLGDIWQSANFTVHLNESHRSKAHPQIGKLAEEIKTVAESGDKSKIIPHEFSLHPALVESIAPRNEVNFYELATDAEDDGKYGKQIERIEKVLDECQYISTKLISTDSLLYIGRGLDYALSMEGSLKLKEISYIHSESYAAGELKHGTISLIEEGMPVIAVATQNTLLEKTVSNIKEVKARGAMTIVICDEHADIDRDAADYLVRIPQLSEMLMPMAATVPMQLLAYYTSVNKGNDVDKPRNLAKSVTVE